MIIIYLFLCGVNLNAQFNVWGNLGLNYSTFKTSNNDVFDITPKYGVNVGVGLPYSFNKYFSVEPEVNIAQKGARLVGMIPNASAYFDDYDIKLTYLEMPVSLKTMIEYKNVVYFLKGGFYFDVSIWTNEEIRSGNVVSHTKSPNIDRPFDYGLQGGIGVELNKKISVQSRLYYGLYNITNFYNSNEHYSNFAINLSVGYKFR